MSSKNSCKYLERCVGDPKKCPFLSYGRSAENCGLYWILDAKEKAEVNYSDNDKKLINELIERFIKAWKERILKNKIRAPGALTGAIFRDWLLEKLKGRICGKLDKERKIKMDFGEWRADIVYGYDSNKKTCKAAIEVKISFDVQHSLMAEGLLKYSNYKWIFVSFHKMKEGSMQRKILDLISKEYGNRFLYICVVERPTKALQELEKLLLE